MIDIPKELMPLARAAEALSALVEISKKANGFEQLEVEHKARIAKLVEQESTTLSAVEKAKADLANAGLRAAAIVEKAQADAVALAGKVVADAEKARDAALDAAKAAKAKENAAEAAEKKAAKSLAEIDAKIKARADDLAAAEAIIAKAAAIKAAMG